MSSSLLLQQCPACLVRLTCIVFVMGASVHIVGVSWGAVARTCSILLLTLLCNFRLVFFSSRPRLLLVNLLSIYIYIYIYIYVCVCVCVYPVRYKNVNKRKLLLNAL